MSSKSPLLHLSGRLGLVGKAAIPVDGFAALTKSHGAYMVRAAITTSDAQKILELEGMKKRIPVEREAENRAKADIPEYTKGADKFVPRAPGTKLDPIMTEQDGQMTYAGKAYAVAHVQGLSQAAYIDEAEHRRKLIAAGQRLHARPRTHQELVDPHKPEMPEFVAGEDPARVDRLTKAYWKRMHKRMDDRRSKSVNQKTMRQSITGQSEGSLLQAAVDTIQEQLGDSMVTPEPEETPAIYDRLLMADKFWFQAPNGQVVWFSQRMKEAVQALLQSPPQLASEDDYRRLEVDLRRMADFDVDQYDGLSGTDAPPLTMLVKVGTWFAMEKRRVRQLVDDLRTEQEIGNDLLPPTPRAPPTPPLRRHVANTLRGVREAELREAEELYR